MSWRVQFFLGFPYIEKISDSVCPSMGLPGAVALRTSWSTRKSNWTSANSHLHLCCDLWLTWCCHTYHPIRPSQARSCGVGVLSSTLHVVGVRNCWSERWSSFPKVIWLKVSGRSRTQHLKWRIFLSFLLLYLRSHQARGKSGSGNEGNKIWETIEGRDLMPRVNIP